MEPVQHRAAARALIESIRLADRDVEAHLEAALSPAYWKGLAPDLSLDDRIAPELTGVPALDPTTLDGIVGRFRDEGYFQMPVLVPPSLTTRMRAAVHALVDNDWPPVFAWVYDEFWRTTRTTPMVALCSAILGERYRQAQNVWTHIVRGERGQAGWAPHIDHRGTDRRLTVWIPISDATVATGCLCVLPKQFLPRADAEAWYERSDLPMKDVTRALHGVRPLPAAAGAVLGWDASLLHWGLARQEPGEPRISFSMEFVEAGSPAEHAIEEMFDVDGADVPDLGARLKTIAVAIKLYQTSEPRISRYVALADRLLEHVNA